MCIYIYNDKILNIVHICVFYVNIKTCIYYIVLKKSRYSTNIFI